MSDTPARLIALAGTFFGADVADVKSGDDFFETLGIDSLKALDLLSELELAFDVEIPDYELQDVRTFAELAAIIDDRRG